MNEKGGETRVDDLIKNTLGHMARTILLVGPTWAPAGHVATAMWKFGVFAKFLIGLGRSFAILWADCSGWFVYFRSEGTD